MVAKAVKYSVATEEKTDLTKPELKALSSLKDREGLGKFKCIKVNFIGDCRKEWASDVGLVKNISEKNALQGLIEKGYLEYKSNQGMWSRFVLTKKATDLIPKIVSTRIS